MAGDGAMSGAEHEMRGDGARRRRIETIAALSIAIVLALAWTIPLSSAQSWGWDESMHAELPAARMVVALQLGRVGEAMRALLDCSQYPFVYPVVLALAQGVFGISEHVCRVVGTLSWCATLFGLFLLGREIARQLSDERGSPARSWSLVPWLAMALGALSPLALSFAGTLFLEVPFTCVAVFALRAWLRRRGDLDARTRARRDLAAGAWITAALFVKFNYGLMLGAGLWLDWICECTAAIRANDLREQLRRTLRLAVVPLVVCVWWFLLPLPGGMEIAGAHRAAFFEFLIGNTGLVTRFAYKPLNAFGHFAWNPRTMVLQALMLLASLRFLSHPAVRCLWFVFLFAWLPVWLHPFHNERFFIPGGAAIWPLAAVGVAACLPTGLAARAVSAVLAAVFVLLPVDDTLWLADRVGVGARDPVGRAYQAGVFARWHDLGGARSLATNGLARADSDALLDAIAQHVKPNERVAWFGIWTELSPAALELGLMLRQGSRERFLEEAMRVIDVSYFADPNWTDEELARFAAGFDVILFTDPIALKAGRGRDYMNAYCQRLTERLGYRKQKLAEISITLPTGTPRVVKLYASRKP
jgi:hypothetical protein